MKVSPANIRLLSVYKEGAESPKLSPIGVKMKPVYPNSGHYLIVLCSQRVINV